jgi:acetyl-CoA acyltransferase
MPKAVGFEMARRAADQVYEAAGVSPEDIRVVELHDCFTANELLSYESLRLTPDGTAEKFIRDGDNTYGGRVVTNPSGGLLSKGHPLGATGLAQCAELTWQLRGEAGARQVEDVNLALQHNIGIGGAAVVTLYEKVS